MDETLMLEVIGLLTEAEELLATGNTDEATLKVTEAKDKLKNPPLPGTGSTGDLH